MLDRSTCMGGTSKDAVTHNDRSYLYDGITESWFSFHLIVTFGSTLIKKNINNSFVIQWIYIIRTVAINAVLFYGKETKSYKME